MNICLLIAIIVITPHRIGQWINTFAHNVRGMGVWGMLLTMGLVSESHLAFPLRTRCRSASDSDLNLWTGTTCRYVQDCARVGSQVLTVQY